MRNRQWIRTAGYAMNVAGAVAVTLGAAAAVTQYDRYTKGKTTWNQFEVALYDFAANSLFAGMAWLASYIVTRDEENEEFQNQTRAVLNRIQHRNVRVAPPAHATPANRAAYHNMGQLRIS